MKKNIYTALLFCGFMALATTSCEDPGDVQFEDDNFSSTLYLKDTGLIDIDFYNINKDVTFTTAVGKGGTDPEIARVALARVFTQEEMDAYNKVVGSNYVILPSDCYEFNKKYIFDVQSENLEMVITLKANIGELDSQIEYVLPIKLTSPHYSVNEKKNELILKPNIITPKVMLESTGKQLPTLMHTKNVYYHTRTFSTKLKLDIPNDGWTFKARFETDQNILHFFVDQYSIEEGKIYKLLPSTAYSLQDIQFGNTDKEKELNLEINYQNGMTEGDYLLPLILKEIDGMPFEVNTSPCYVHVNVTSDIMKIVIAPANISGNNKQDDYKNLVDGTSVSNGEIWQSLWSFYGAANMGPYCDETYGVYVDINNLDEKITELFKIKMTVQATNNYPKNFRIYGKGKRAADWTMLEEIINAYPDDNTKVWEKEIGCSTEISAIRIALLTSKSGDLTKVKINGELKENDWNYISPNVGLAEIELSGY